MQILKTGPLSEKKIAIVATDGFEESELLSPKRALEEAGARVDIVSLNAGSIRSWGDGGWGDSVAVDKTIHEVADTDYDAVMLPGGVINADKIRADHDVTRFLTVMAQEGKPIAAICHGPWALIETGLMKDRVVTSWPSLKTDLENAGARWVDKEVVSDKGWVTSRKPADLEAFNKKMIEEFEEGQHALNPVSIDQESA
jgi:protease I